MATAFCTSCGRVVPAGAAFCPVCGASVVPISGSPVPGGGAAVAPYGGFGRPGPVDPRTTPQGQAAEQRGLRAVRIGLILAIVGGLVGVVEDAYNAVTPIVSVSSSGTGFPVALPGLELLAGILTVAAAVVIAELVFLRIGLSALARIFPNESTPAALVLVALVGLVMVFGGVAVLLDALQQAISCAAGAQPIPASCVTGSPFWSAVALLGLGAVIALIGYVGTLIGLFRIGTAYQDTTIQVGTVLLIIPFIAIVGAILIVLRIGKILERRPRPAVVGAVR